MRLKRFLRRYPADRKLRLIGPSCAGIISPGKGFTGIMPPHIYMAGRLGIVGVRGGGPDEGAWHRCVDIGGDRR